VTYTVSEHRFTQNDSIKIANSSNPKSVYKPRHFDCNVITHILPVSPTTKENRTLGETHTASASLAKTNTLLLKTPSKSNTPSLNYALTDED